MRSSSSRQSKYSRGGVESLSPDPIAMPAFSEAVLPFVEQFNGLAMKYAIAFQMTPDTLTDLSPLSLTAESPAVTESAQTKILTFMKRSTTSNDLAGKAAKVPRSKSRWSLSKSHSTTDVESLLGRGRGLIGVDLDEAMRTFGSLDLVLADNLATGPLQVPTLVYFAVKNILDHGVDTPGLFRLSGSVPVLNELVEKFATLRPSSYLTISPKLVYKSTDQVHYTIHEVACLLKRYIAGLPRGLIPSPGTYKALFQLCNRHADIQASDVPLMCALALRTIESQSQLSLLCAVFGLCRAVSDASETAVNDESIKATDKVALMKPETLGIIFGPLLHSSVREEVSEDERPQSPGSPINSDMVRVEVEKARNAAQVAEFLIYHWHEIVRALDAQGFKGKESQIEVVNSVTEEKESSSPRDNSRRNSALQEVANNTAPSPVMGRRISTNLDNAIKENVEPGDINEDVPTPSSSVFSLNTPAGGMPKTKSEMNLFARLRGNTRQTTASKRSTIVGNTATSEVSRLSKDLQIRDEELSRELSRASREIEELRRRKFDFVGLTKRLQESKEEIKFWRKRAESAEKKLEKLGKSMSYSHRTSSYIEP